jgi:hypothetical protein
LIYTIENGNEKMVRLSKKEFFKYISSAKHGKIGIEVTDGKRTPDKIYKDHYFSHVACVDGFNNIYAIYRTKIGVKNIDDVADYITVKFDNELNEKYIFPFCVDSKMVKDGNVYSINTAGGYLEVLKWGE